MKAFICVLCLSLFCSCSRLSPARTVEDKLHELSDGIRDPTKVFDLEDGTPVLVHNGGYGDGLAYEIYLKKANQGKELPLIVFAMGSDDRALRKETGKAFKDLNRTISWARMFAQHDFYVLVYESDGDEARLSEVLGLLRADWRYRDIRMDDIGVWASGQDGGYGIGLISGKVSIPSRITCVSFCYPDLTWDPGIRDDVRIQIIKAGKDRATNLKIDGFLGSAGSLAGNIEVVTYEEAGHGFDYYREMDETTRGILLQAVDFFRRCLRP